MKVVELHEMKLVGIRVVCPGHQYIKEIPKASVELENRLQEIRDVVKPVKLVGAFIAEDVTGESFQNKNTQSNDIKGLMMKLEIHMKSSIAGY